MKKIKPNGERDKEILFEVKATKTSEKDKTRLLGMDLKCLG